MTTPHAFDYHRRTATTLLAHLQNAAQTLGNLLRRASNVRQDHPGTPNWLEDLRRSRELLGRALAEMSRTAEVC